MDRLVEYINFARLLVERDRRIYGAQNVHVPDRPDAVLRFGPDRWGMSDGAYSMPGNSRSLRNDEMMGEITMGATIEIKGLGSAVQAARRGIADARGRVAGMYEAAASLNAAVDDVTRALRAAEADIRSEAETLGNGAPPLDGPAPSDPPPPATDAPKVGL
jgi:hypothetical protein